MGAFAVRRDGWWRCGPLAPPLPASGLSDTVRGGWCGKGDGSVPCPEEVGGVLLLAGGDEARVGLLFGEVAVLAAFGDLALDLDQCVNH
jgi:hypothetical protein